MHERPSKMRVTLQESQEVLNLRSKVKSMARLLAECREVLSQNVKERGVLLERIRFLECKSIDVQPTSADVSDLKILQKAKKYKAKIRNLHKLVKTQKRDLRMARYLNKRLFEHYLKLYQGASLSHRHEKAESSPCNPQIRDVLRKCENYSSDDSLIIPKGIKDSIWNKRDAKFAVKKTREENFFPNQRVEGGQAHSPPDLCSHPNPKVNFMDEDREPSDVSLPDTPPSLMLDLLAVDKYRESSASGVPRSSPLEAAIFKGLREQKEMADKQMNALGQFHEALKEIKIRRNLARR